MSLGLRSYHIILNLREKSVGSRFHIVIKTQIQRLREDSSRLIVTCDNHCADSKFPHFLCSCINCFSGKHSCYSAIITSQLVVILDKHHYLPFPRNTSTYFEFSATIDPNEGRNILSRSRLMKLVDAKMHYRKNVSVNYVKENTIP